MSHGKLREEKNCLNCGNTVEEKFCPNCGQENTENRKPFHYLFTHFVEDFTHYDGQFWGTIKNLLFKPGKLTETYIAGKRQQFVPPVKLYIFISFITFFLFAIFPPYSIDYDGKKSELSASRQTTVESVAVTELQNEMNRIKAQQNISSEDSVNIIKITALLKDTISTKQMQNNLELNTGLGESFEYKGFMDRKSYDISQAKNPNFWDFVDRPIAHKMFELKEKGAKKGDIAKSLLETSFRNLPKALFLYLPIFAFFLWLFHNKKKWWYFEHGVFTLHYFSFLLVMILFLSLLSRLVHKTGSGFIDMLVYILIAATGIYILFYFFLAHHRVYKYKGISSFIVGSVLFFLNFMAFMFVVIILSVISFLMIH